MKFKVIIVFLLLLFTQNSNSEDDPGYVELPTLDEIFYTNIMFQINDKLLGFIYDDSILTIEYKDTNIKKNYNFQITENDFLL